MERYHVNPYLFFYLNGDNVVLWNYESHEQYILNKQYLERLIQISKEPNSGDVSIDKDLIENNIISKYEYPKIDWEWDCLSKIYHMGTQNTIKFQDLNNLQEWSNSYAQDCKTLEKNHIDLFVNISGKKITLPTHEEPPQSSNDFFQILMKRQTSRHFTGEQIKQQSLSNILFYTFGMAHGDWLEIKQKGLLPFGYRKTSPSAGGIHSVQCYLAVYNVENIPPGIYHYNVKEHHLNLINAGEYANDIAHILCQQYFAKDLSAGIFFVSHLEKVWWKYKHSRSYREALLDTGHLSQTLQLCATSQDLLTWITGLFHDQSVAEMLGLTSASQIPIAFVGLGTGSPQALHPEMIKALQGNISE